MASLIKCKKCGKLFSDASDSEMCGACNQEHFSPLDHVKAYLKDHEAATLEEISRDTQIDLQTVLMLYKEGQLVLMHELSPILICESCEALIRSGRYCASCAKKTSSSLREAFSSDNKPEAQKEIKGEYRSGIRKK